MSKVVITMDKPLNCGSCPASREGSGPGDPFRCPFVKDASGVYKAIPNIHEIAEWCPANEIVGEDNEEKK